MQGNSRFQVVQGGDIFADPKAILVCPVNCQPGVMGAGLAKAMADRYFHLKEKHDLVCRGGMLWIGKVPLVLATDRVDLSGEPQPIVLFPTKDHWKDPSRYDWVFRGLASLYCTLNTFRPYDEFTVAMPALGCGLGGLDWEVVREMIRVWSYGLHPRFQVNLYPPRD